MNKKTPFAEVLQYLKDSKKLSQQKVADEINSETELVIDKSTINRFKNGNRELNSEVIEAMHKLYNINPEYLNGKSKVMLDDAGIKFEKFKSLVYDWKMEEIKDRIDGEDIKIKFLVLTIDNSFYNFLKNVDSAKIFQEEGMLSFEEEFEKCKKKHNEDNQNEYGDYILIPKKILFEINNNEKERKKNVIQILDLGIESAICDE